MISFKIMGNMSVVHPLHRCVSFCQVGIIEFCQHFIEYKLIQGTKRLLIFVCLNSPNTVSIYKKSISFSPSRIYPINLITRFGSFEIICWDYKWCWTALHHNGCKELRVEHFRHQRAAVGRFSFLNGKFKSLSLF